MKKINFIIALLFLYGAVLPVNSILANNTLISLSQDEQHWLSQNHTVRVRVGHWPPFMFSEEKFDGISVAYIKKIFERHGIDFKFVSDKDVPWKEALDKIRSHQKIDLILTMKITPERKRFIIFTDEYLFLPWVIFTRKDSAFISGMNDLEGKTVSVPKGYVMHDLLKKNYPAINLLVVSGSSSAPNCLKALAQGEVDAYVGNLAVGSYVIQDKGYHNVKVAAPTPFGTHNQAMGIRDDWPELASIINKTMTSMTSQEHADIRNQWLSIRYEHGLQSKDVVKWILITVSILSTIVITILFWNRRLQKEITARLKMEDDQRHLLKQIERQKETLARSNKELEQFAYVASHDLRAPLRKISSFTELFEKKYKNRLDETADRYIHYIVDASQRMQKMIDALLSFSRVQRAKLDPEPVNMNDVFKNVMSDIEEHLQKTGGSVEATHLPVIHVNQNLIYMLFQNLISNALKFRSEKPPVVQVNSLEAKSVWHFTVKDNGIGIDPGAFDKIFDVFHRLHTEEQYPGSGIGLSICRKVVERHNGSIWVDSEPGRGSTFHFTIPKPGENETDIN